MAKKISIAVLVALLGGSFSFSQIITEETFKIGRTLSLIDGYYVDSADIKSLTEEVIVGLLRNLDPHSTYIPADEVDGINESLSGNFDGIGIQFNLLHDSIVVIEPISGGPSEKIGIKAGDRIVYIDGENVAGVGISTEGVRKRLMGLKGTKVTVGVSRNKVNEIIYFVIVRDKIPLESLDAAYMIDKETAYFRFNKFAATTEQEFKDAISRLRKSNPKNVIIDLRGNGGGVMSAATDMANHFFDDKRLIVYMEGRKTPRQDFVSNGGGDLSGSRLVVLVDESSASASEIFSGAIQDWDRGVIIGRRTFGKGLVQGQFYLTDGSMIRLTLARYYTPTGRLIQSPYDEGYDAYLKNYYSRFSDTELLSPSTVDFPDSLRYSTLVNGRDVFGGGGILPDIFVAVDTSHYSNYYGTLSRMGVFNSFVLEYADKNRENILVRYGDFDEFKGKFEFTEDEIKQFIAQGENAGVKYDERQYRKSEKEILLVLKALVANSIWRSNEYYMIVNENDPAIDAALRILSDKDGYNSILKNR